MALAVLGNQEPPLTTPKGAAASEPSAWHALGWTLPYSVAALREFPSVHGNRNHIQSPPRPRALGNCGECALRSASRRVKMEFLKADTFEWGFEGRVRIYSGERTSRQFVSLSRCEKPSFPLHAG